MEKKFFKAFLDEYNDLDTQDYSSLLDLIRRIVRDILGKSRSCILLALEDFGYDSEGFITGYHRIGTNEIYLNRNLLKIMKNDKIPEEHFKAYLFHLLVFSRILIDFTAEPISGVFGFIFKEKLYLCLPSASSHKH